MDLITGAGLLENLVQSALAHMVIMIIKLLHYQLAKPVRRIDSVRQVEYFSQYPLKSVLNWANICFANLVRVIRRT